MTMVDFALESSNKAALVKAFTALGNQLGYSLIDENNMPTAGVAVAVNVPPGSSRAGIPDGYRIRGPFVHRQRVYDGEGVEIEAPILGTNWKLDIRLSDIPGFLDREVGIDEIAKSKLKTWIKDTGSTVVRGGANTDYPADISYIEKTLAGGDWLRLYHNVVFAKHEFAGGREL